MKIKIFILTFLLLHSAKLFSGNSYYLSVKITYYKSLFDNFNEVEYLVPIRYGDSMDIGAYFNKLITNKEELVNVLNGDTLILINNDFNNQSEEVYKKYKNCLKIQSEFGPYVYKNFESKSRIDLVIIKADLIVDVYQYKKVQGCYKVEIFDNKYLLSKINFNRNYFYLKEFSY